MLEADYSGICSLSFGGAQIFIFCSTYLVVPSNNLLLQATRLENFLVIAKILTIFYAIHILILIACFHYQSSFFPIDCYFHFFSFLIRFILRAKFALFLSPQNCKRVGVGCPLFFSLSRWVNFGTL